MVFTSILFLLIFLPLFLLVYHTVPNQAKNIVALLFSSVFYVWGAPMFFWLLLLLLVSNFFIVKRMESVQGPERIKKLLLWLSLLLNLGNLAYFKYANFFVDNVQLLLGYWGFSAFEWTHVALPIGISFFTFQSITYTLDVYWGRHKSLERVQDYLLYILLFPQLIAGPIIRFNTIADEIRDRSHNFTANEKLKGVYLFVIGLAKKVLIANQVGVQVDDIFTQVDSISSPIAWLGIVAYSIQIYFDFSGYSDMAIGLGKIMGFNFPENFKSPYTAQSITDFWRKWHITLGAFMRDYLYIPLGGNRSGNTYVTYLNLTIVFSLSGLWHGAAWTFVIWGIWHGLFLVIERAFLGRWLKRIPLMLRVGYQYLVVLIGWVFFRADDFSMARKYLSRMFGADPDKMETPAFDFDPGFVTFLLIGLIFSFIVLLPVGKRWDKFFFSSDYSDRQHFALFVGSLGLFILSVSYVATTDFNPFIYFRF